jgi:threonyl-tRNA synthetase
MEAKGVPYTVDVGGAAFYAPKIDVFIDDALGREWQLATVQLDYQLPQRFDLEYRAADGGFERPVIIHYAIYGSFERFTGIITEHFAGAFPLWLAPVQVMVVPIADRHIEYAARVRGALADVGLRAEVDDRSERMQAKLRDAQEQKVPVMVVVGDRDQEAGAVSPRLRTGEASQGVALDEFVADLRGRAERRELWPYAEDAAEAAPAAS